MSGWIYAEVLNSIHFEMNALQVNNFENLMQLIEL